ncbi:MAG TPA: hypothetical protein VJ917_01360, partial [Saprospiraceae bacterium]|nr:hypothetical protein [Saprospiraceae bacterium]
MTGSAYRFTKVIVFLFLQLWVFPLLSQDSLYFSKVPDELFEQMETFFDPSNRKELKEQRKALEENLEMELIEEDNFILLVDMLNAMKERKLNAWPYFYNYLRAAQSIFGLENGNEEYRKWQSAIDAAMKLVENNRYTRFNDLLEFTVQFYETGYIVSSRAGASWHVNDRAPKFDFDDEGELLVRFEDVHLSAARKEDSLVIQNTSGAFRPEDKHWLAEGGKVTWWRYDQDDVYCELGDYDIDLKRPIFEIKDVAFTHPRLFPGQTLRGTLMEKVYHSDEDGEGDYPKFDGAGEQVDLTRLIEDVSLVGGFSLHGTTIYVSGNKGSRAKLMVKGVNDEEKLRAIAPRFKVSKDRVYSRSASLVIYMTASDSLTHPSVSLDYKPSAGLLDIGKGEGLQANSPFFDSYHGFTFSVSELQYKIKMDSIVLGRKRLGLGKVNKEITFESPNFFDYGEYLRAQNIGRVNPLARLNKLAAETGERKFNLATVIDQINPQLTQQSIQTLLSDLVKQGFINYNATDREVIVKDKLLHYAEAALKNTDYDKMRMVSDSPDENGVLDLDNMELLLGGVENVVLSDSQKVAMKPYFNEVTLLEDNRIRMHGKLYAGYTTFEGLEFYYDYPEHKIYLDSVKEFQLYIPTGRMMEGGQQEAVSVNSLIESMKAVLLIDAPHNKASLVDIPIFPSMHTRGSSYVFYDEKSIHGGVYTRDSFYFQLDEFDLESLDELDSTEISFQGALYSKDIMETFQDSLILREDRSLGLLSTTPEKGLSLYREKGRFAGEIDLSNRGFYGNGEVSYLKASVNSDDVLFKPKQLTGTADIFELEGDSTAGNELPKVKGIDVSLDWRPYADSMYIRSAEAPFQMYEKGLHQFK